MNLNKSSKYSILTLAMTLSLLMLISCGNNPKPASTDNSEVDTTAISAPKPQPTDTAEHKATPRSKEEVKKEWDDFYRKNVYGNSKQSRAYDTGYDAGFEQGTYDAANGLEWHGMYDDSNRYKGKARDDYEDGYESGYQDGYEAEHSGREPLEW